MAELMRGLGWVFKRRLGINGHPSGARAPSRPGTGIPMQCCVKRSGSSAAAHGASAPKQTGKSCWLRGARRFRGFKKPKSLSQRVSNSNTGC